MDKWGAYTFNWWWSTEYAPAKRKIEEKQWHFWLWSKKSWFNFIKNDSANVVQSILKRLCLLDKINLVRHRSHDLAAQFFFLVEFARDLEVEVDWSFVRSFDQLIVGFRLPFSLLISCIFDWLSLPKAFHSSNQRFQCLF